MASAPVHPRGARTGAVPRSAVTRWALAVALVLGVLGMHALMGSPAVAAGTDAVVVGEPMSMSMAVPGAQHAADRLSPVEQSVGAGGDTTPMGGHSPANSHSMLTMCLAVLGAVVSVVLLVAALAHGTADVERAAGARSVCSLSSLGRPPPWAVPSLHQLSLLRV